MASFLTGGFFNGIVSAEDNIHLTDAGTIRAKLLLNASDRDNVELRAESLGSTMKFFTVGTEALLLDASQNATFAGSITANTTSTTTALLGRDGTDGDVVQIYNGATGTTKVIALGASGNDGTIYSQYGDLLLQPSAGNVGIGTTNPTQKLVVNTNATAGIANLSDIDKTSGNLVRFTNPQYSADASMGILLRVFPDSDVRQGAGIIATGGGTNERTNLSLFVSTDGAGTSSLSYAALTAIGLTGNIGIGTISPGVKLHIAATGAPDVRIQDLDGTNQYGDRGHNGGVTTYVSRNNTSFGSHVFYSADGTTTQARVIFSQDFGTGSSLVTATGAAGSSYGGFLAVSSVATAQMWASDGGLIYIGSRSNHSVNFSVNNQIKMMINTSGNVGIGTTSPNGKLDIQVDTANVLSFRDADSWSGYAGAAGIISSNANSSGIQPLEFYASGYNFKGGNVGIGTTSPDKLLDVSSDSTPTIRITNTLQSSSNYTIGAFEFYSEDASNPGGARVLSSILCVNNAGSAVPNGELAFYTALGGGSGAAATEKMRISSAGGISFGSTGTAYGTSGQILKSNGNASPTWIDGSAIPGVPAGSGTVNTIPLWTPDGDTLGNSPITISGNDIISSGRGVIENTTALTTGVVDSLLIKTLSSGTTITNGFGTAIAFYLENTVYSVVNEMAKISIIQTDTIAIDNKMVFSVKDNNILADKLTLNGSGGIFPGKLSVGHTSDASNPLDVRGAGTLGRFQSSNQYVDVLFINSGSTNYLGFNNASFQVYLNGGSGANIVLNITETAATFRNDVIVKTALLSNQENTDVDTGTEVVAQVSTSTYTAAFFDFVIKKTTNVRSGTVYACHDGAGTPLIAFTETSTNDLGDTSDVTLSVDISGGNMRLLATVTSDDWSVKSLIRAI